MRRKQRSLQELIHSVSSSIANITASPGRRVVDRLRSRIQEVDRKLQEYESVGQLYVKQVAREEKLNAMQELAASLDNFEEEAAVLSAALDVKKDSLEAAVIGTTSSDSTPQFSTHRPRSFVERSRLPVFSGKVEEFHEFRKQFQELTKGEGFPEAILINKLNTAVPA